MGGKERWRKRKRGGYKERGGKYRRRGNKESYCVCVSEILREGRRGKGNGDLERGKEGKKRNQI